MAQKQESTDQLEFCFQRYVLWWDQTSLIMDDRSVTKGNTLASVEPHCSTMTSTIKLAGAIIQTFLDRTNSHAGVPTSNMLDAGREETWVEKRTAQCLPLEPKKFSA
jgi:hypothetical protein